jgi:hypothetical protein
MWIVPKGPQNRKAIVINQKKKKPTKNGCIRANINHEQLAWRNFFIFKTELNLFSITDLI